MLLHVGNYIFIGNHRRDLLLKLSFLSGLFFLLGILLLLGQLSSDLSFKCISGPLLKIGVVVAHGRAFHEHRIGYKIAVIRNRIKCRL